MDKNKEKLIEKVKNMGKTYQKYRLHSLGQLTCEVFETCDDSFRSEPDSSHEWHPIQAGDIWGKEHWYAWFRGDYKIPDSDAGKNLWLLSKANAPECLLFINGKPAGLFDYTTEVATPQIRVHEIQPLTFSAAPSKTIHIAVEAYAGHKVLGTMPFDDYGNCNNVYPNHWDHCFQGMLIVEKDAIVDHFLISFRTVWQYYSCLGSDSAKKWNISNMFEEIFRILPQMPDEYPQEYWHSKLEEANVLLDKELDCRQPDCTKNYLGYAGLIGHSHLDTAWQWPVKETIHKAARTFSNALRVMDCFPEYTFIQSSVAYIQWMEKYYPDIYNGIRRRTKEGRWEPNGGSWIECDTNITGGECLIRQFLKGQRYLREHLHYQADAFWQPDTFGYSSCIPQVLKGCGIKYFLTTKLSWNESNQFPYDTFIWKGMDGTEILTHFNIVNCWPDIENICKNIRNNVINKDVTDMKLISYGFGDGGGGPSYDMVEMARMAKDLPGIPRSEHTTVSKFMKYLEYSVHNIPVYDGELYLELHRGTLTQMHEIKRSNRLAEISLRTLEMVNVIFHQHYGIKQRNEELNRMYETLLINQFHDILPGTSLQEVSELAIKQNHGIIDEADNLTRNIINSCSENSKNLILFNSLSWEYARQITVDDEGMIPENYSYQRYKDQDGQARLVIGGIVIPPLSTITITMTKQERPMPDSPFSAEGNRLITPFADMQMDDTGAIVSFIDRRCGRQLVKDPKYPLNTLLMGEDIPYIWDNWDIDQTQQYKMQPQRHILSRKLVTNGCLQLRYRTIYAIGQHSTLTQDMVVYSDNPRIDFETIVDWQDRHNLLKVQFNVDMKVTYARHEMQFGYVDRPNNYNTSIEKAKFEVCNHKYTDLSDTRYGVALLNDCKYGISVYDSDMRLSLHKGGCRPDPNGDAGTHKFTYSFLPHNNGFSCPSVVRPAYELNMKPLCVSGALDSWDTPLIKVEPSNIVVESIKFAEDGDGYIVRLYDAECTTSNAEIHLDQNIAKVIETNMLEDEQKELAIMNHMVKRTVKPFEIVTLKLKT